MYICALYYAIKISKKRDYEFEKEWGGVQGKIWKEERAGRNVYYRLKNKIKRKKRRKLCI